MESIKLIRISKEEFHDMLKKGFIKTFNDFKRKMKLFINNYDMVPIVFIQDEFIGGYSEFVKIYYLTNIARCKKYSNK